MRAHGGKFSQPPEKANGRWGSTCRSSCACASAPHAEGAIRWWESNAAVTVRSMIESASGAGGPWYEPARSSPDLIRGAWLASVLEPNS